MKDVLCIYYSRTGKTKQAMEEIAQALDGELLELRDGVDRAGWKGFLRSGLDAMRKDTHPLEPVEPARKLGDYRLVILGTPVWAGRCSSVMRGFLKQYGRQLPNTALVITRGGESRYTEVFRQMDGYLPERHIAAVSLRMDSVGCHFWEEDFLRRVREFLDGPGAETEG